MSGRGVTALTFVIRIHYIKTTSIVKLKSNNRSGNNKEEQSSNFTKTVYIFKIRNRWGKHKNRQENNQSIPHPYVYL